MSLSKAKMVESYPDLVILILRGKDCWMDCHETDNPGPQRMNPNHLKDLNHWMDCHENVHTRFILMFTFMAKYL